LLARRDYQGENRHLHGVNQSITRRCLPRVHGGRVPGPLCIRAGFPAGCSVSGIAD